LTQWRAGDLRLQVSSMILDNAQLKFYQWEGDVNAHLDAVSELVQYS
jgi:hypothetical protein